jgi:RNA polymerase sigma factor (sigma-70 family)
MTEDIDAETTSGTGPQARDERLLAQLAAAKELDDGGLRRNAVAAELLAPYWRYILRLVRWRLSDLRVAEDDVEEVAAAVFERLGRALTNKTKFRKPFKYVVLDNIDWACADFRRERRRRSGEALCDPELLAEAGSQVGRKRNSASGQLEALTGADDDDPGDGLAAQARAFGQRIEGLPERDREILTRRFFAGTPPSEIAQHRGASRESIDTATHRALRKLQASDQLADVRDQRARTEGDVNGRKSIT